MKSVRTNAVGTHGVGATGWWCVVLVCVSLMACSKDQRVEGRAVYLEPFQDGNSFSCATCHSLNEPAADGFRRPGHPLGDAVGRPDYKNGQYTDLRAAVNTCVEHWMRADPLGADDERWTALEAFLAAQHDGSAAPSVDFSIVAPPAVLTGGSEPAGEQLFNGSCAVCHGVDAIGTTRGPSLRGFAYTPEYIAERVRTSGSAANPAYSSLTGGAMPFWAAERLSDDELRDAIAYVLTLQTLKNPNDGGPDSGPGDGGSCPSTHAMVGKTATLSPVAHEVEGTVTVVNDCTLRVDDFTYDGGGIVVEFYAGTQLNFDNGFSLSDNLKGPRFDNATLHLTIPSGKSLDDFDSISVWCVDVKTSFGHGSFQ